MNKFLKHLNSAGDTIVEVLVCVAVVSMILAGAFVSTRRSSQTVRTSQERGEALKLAESQVEKIKQAITTGTPDVLAAGNFCVGAAPFSSPCTSTIGIPYQTTVTHTAGSHDFIVKVTWDSLAGGTNNVELDYKAQ